MSSVLDFQFLSELFPHLFLLSIPSVPSYFLSQDTCLPIQKLEKSIFLCSPFNPYFLGNVTWNSICYPLFSSHSKFSPPNFLVFFKAVVLLPPSLQNPLVTLLHFLEKSPITLFSIFSVFPELRFQCSLSSNRLFNFIHTPLFISVSLITYPPHFRFPIKRIFFPPHPTRRYFSKLCLQLVHPSTFDFWYSVCIVFFSLCHRTFDYCLISAFLLIFRNFCLELPFVLFNFLS